MELWTKRVGMEPVDAEELHRQSQPLPVTSQRCWGLTPDDHLAKKADILSKGESLP